MNFVYCNRKDGRIAVLVDESDDGLLLAFESDSGKVLQRFVTGIDLEDWECVDLFECGDLLPFYVEEIVSVASDLNYEECREIKRKLAALGWYVGFYLDGEMFDLMPMSLAKFLDIVD